MSTQNNLEQILKGIHLMISECPKIKGDPDRVVIDKNRLFVELDRVSQCMYDMLDEYGLTKSKKEEAQYQINRQYEETMKKANSTAEDVYSASVLYTDEAITRLVRILDENQRKMESIYHEMGKSIQHEKDKLRKNQRELQDTLFEMKDSNLYLNILNDRRVQLENEKENKERQNLGKTIVMNPGQKLDIKVNEKLIEQMGLNTDGSVKPEKEPTIAKPEVKVDTESNYFKWKKEQEKK